MKGPRVFAFVALAALLVLARTGWVVRNHLDILAGRWGSIAGSLGVQGRRDFSPVWAFKSGDMLDPAAKALVEPLYDPSSYEARQAKIDHGLEDPAVRPRILTSALRRAFSALTVPEPGSMRVEGTRGGLHARIDRARRLAEEGEHIEPKNAFFPSCRWAVEFLAKDRKAADAALARASEGSYYDDGSFAESRIVTNGFERQYGYRGNALRFMSDVSVLLPQLASLSHATQELAKEAPLTDPRRVQVMRLGEILIRTGQTSIAVLVGQNLIATAAGHGDHPLTPEKRLSNLRSFVRAVPSAGADAFLPLLKHQTIWPATEGIDEAFSSPVPVVGAALLFATVGCTFLALNRRNIGDDTFRGRIVRANWAWLAVIPAAFMDGGSSATGEAYAFLGAGAVAAFLARSRWGWRVSPAVASAVAFACLGLCLGGGRLLLGWTVPVVLYVAALGLPERSRWIGYTLAFGLAGAGAVLWPHLELAMVPLFLGFVAVAAWGALPARRKLEWAGGVCAVLYLIAVGLNLRLDAQQGEVLQAFRTEADRSRADLGL